MSLSQFINNYNNQLLFNKTSIVIDNDEDKQKFFTFIDVMHDQEQFEPYQTIIECDDYCDPLDYFSQNINMQFDILDELTKLKRERKIKQEVLSNIYSLEINGLTMDQLKKLPTNIKILKLTGDGDSELKKYGQLLPPCLEKLIIINTREITNEYEPAEYSDNITDYDLIMMPFTITHLEIPNNCHITPSGLNHLPWALEYLRLSELSDTTPLVRLKYLKHLILEDDTFNNDDLHCLTNLTHLELNGNTRITNVNKLIGLTSLIMRENSNITDVLLPNLTTLILPKSKLTNIDNLSKKLTILDIGTIVSDKTLLSLNHIQDVTTGTPSMGKNYYNILN